MLLTYPFTDEVLRGVKGDYLNVYLDVTAMPGTQIVPPLIPAVSPQPGTGTGGTGGTGGTSQALPLPLPEVPTAGTDRSSR